MKEKTSITLSPELLSRVDRMAGSKYSRSAVIEWILRLHFQRRARARERAHDLALLNKHAERLNAEALDVLEYQVGEE